MNGVTISFVKLHKNDFEIENIKNNNELASLDEITQQFPHGAYTTFRTYDFTKSLYLPAHLQRMKYSAKLSGFDLNWDQDLLRSALRDVVSKNNQPNELRVRLLLDMVEDVGAFYIFTERLRIPTFQEYRDGVKVVTNRMERQNPKAKLTNFIPYASRIRQELLHEGINEVLMFNDEGEIREGLSSNFFMVMGEEIYTPEEGILHGITREIVLEEIVDGGLKVHYANIKLSDLNFFDETFITSSSRGVLPVVAVDGVSIADGKPGAITCMLMKKYEGHVARELETI